MLPNSTQRTAILGRTGSGKTQSAVWLLSLADFNKRPWIVVDYKHDKLIKSIPKISTIDFKTARVPKEPGLYRISPKPGEDEDVEMFLWAIWERGHTGLYIDEGYMIPNIEAFQAILTQGRSKHIPAIILSQRPVWMSRFVLSEADFYQIFALNDMRDRKTVASFLPAEFVKKYLNVPGWGLGKYSSVWYDVSEDKIFRLKPVPESQEIIASIAARLKQKKARI